MVKEICPVTETIKLIGKKWNLLILKNLSEESMSFNELKRNLDSISSKTLSESLSYLSKEGLIVREVKVNSPIRVEYSLTKKANGLRPVLEDMGRWGKKWL
ncbi:MAG TPA: helix-turn-helix transcriptional regulator [Nanoarchaeota archaeon]|nr:MAG: hypothetical protein QT01_C0004G0024 [archaeon GW2011_AR6]MBS3082616.1 helix-turn-helix transcriptional regulator [Candidatus Pacearchaeota archaeon]HIH17508.1 helix-turn-helix transcriptional regulator [Nanoarchaeota archaeon]HIH33694.1 helix-turn-helix transcriptional regulator [Nanoarchaeota archaeon]HIH51482.1 helix-turn-helix transcriptional regulator [Nanoarchaeota archaeon]